MLADNLEDMARQLRDAAEAKLEELDRPDVQPAAFGAAQAAFQSALFACIALRRGEVEAAKDMLASAMTAMNAAGAPELWPSEAVTGRKVIHGARQGGASRRGRYSKLTNKVLALQRAKPHLSSGQIAMEIREKPATVEKILHRYRK